MGTLCGVLPASTPASPTHRHKPHKASQHWGHFRHKHLGALRKWHTQLPVPRGDENLNKISLQCRTVQPGDRVCNSNLPQRLCSFLPYLLSASTKKVQFYTSFGNGLSLLLSLWSGLSSQAQGRLRREEITKMVSW